MHTDTRFCKVCLKERPARPLNWPSNKGVLVGRVCKACASELAKARYMAGMPPDTLAKYLARRNSKPAPSTEHDRKARVNEMSKLRKAKARSTPEGKAKDKLYEFNRKIKRLEAKSNGEFKNESDILA